MIAALPSSSFRWYKPSRGRSFHLHGFSGSCSLVIEVSWHQMYSWWAPSHQLLSRLVRRFRRYRQSSLSWMDHQLTYIVCENMFPPKNFPNASIRALLHPMHSSLTCMNSSGVWLKSLPCHVAYRLTLPLVWCVPGSSLNILWKSIIRYFVLNIWPANFNKLMAYWNARLLKDIVNIFNKLFPTILLLNMR